MAETYDVDGKGAIVTGGGSGINLAFVKELHSRNCSVLIADIALHRSAQEWLAGLNAEAPAKVHFHKTDVSDWKQLEEIFDVFEKLIGGVPYLVCPGAGIYEPSHNGFWADKDVDGHYKILDINLAAPIKMTRIAVRKMLQSQKPGIIIHVSSTGAQKESIITPIYQASKAGISTFVRGMGKLHEMEGIRVVAVAPGIIRSPLFTDHPEAMRFIDESKDTMLEPEAVARAMYAVATDAKYPAGTVLECADLHDKWRVVNRLNDPGPQGAATWSSNKDLAIIDVKKVIESEKGAVE